jgi:hypothetical protein
MNYAEELRGLSTAAEAGDADAGETLLQRFATLSEDPTDAHPELVRHLARCVGRFINSDSRTKSALRAFCIARPAHRPVEPSVRARHVNAMTEYYRQRALGKGRVASIESAAKAGSLSEAGVRRLLEKNDSSISVGAMMCLSTEERNKLANPPRKKHETRK